MSKPAILVVMDYFLPAYKAGGPIRSISNMVDQLGDEFDFFIVARDRDCDGAGPFRGVEAGRWLDRDGYRVCHVPGPRWLRRVIRDAPYDLIYLNSFFSVFAITTLLLRRFGAVRRKPIVLAPRGELSTGALGLKRTKKKLFVTLARWTGLHRGVIWQASSEMEREEIQAYDEGPTVITPNIPARVDIEQEDLASKPPKAAGEARFVFLSRIAKKKNLDYALGLLEGVEGRVVFDIYGTREDREYLDRCAELMNRLPASVRARYVGPVPPDEVHATLQGYHFFLFPTLNENFGHVILEALLAGLPVLTSDQTYWRGLEAASAGWDLRLEDREQFAARVRECVAMGADRYRRMSRSAHDLARRYLEDPRGVDATRRLLLDAVAGRAGGARSPRDVAPS